MENTNISSGSTRLLRGRLDGLPDEPRPGVRLTQFSNLRRSSSDSTSGSSLVSPIPQDNATASPAIALEQNLGHNTTHVVTEKLSTDSLGARARDLAPEGGD